MKSLNCKESNSEYMECRNLKQKSIKNTHKCKVKISLFRTFTWPWLNKAARALASYPNGSPGGPGNPGGPGGPTGPGFPDSPEDPLGPIGPINPGLPLLPSLPGGPLGPGGPYKNEKYRKYGIFRFQYRCEKCIEDYLWLILGKKIPTLMPGGPEGPLIPLSPGRP